MLCVFYCVWFIPIKYIIHGYFYLKPRLARAKHSLLLASELLLLNSLLFQPPKQSQADSTILDFILHYYEPLFVKQGASEGLGSFLRQGGTLFAGCLTTGEILLFLFEAYSEEAGSASAEASAEPPGRRGKTLHAPCQDILDAKWSSSKPEPSD